MTDVEFTVRLLGDWTERLVCVLGSAPEIGTWDVEKALSMELVECQGEESVWRATVEFAANTNTLEYKYVLKHKQTRELISWEGLPGNRALTIAPGTNIALGAASCQSSTYITSRAPIPGPRDATLGNNGDTNGFQEWRCCRTNKEVNPWWEVDLGKEYIISSIHLWNAMTYHEQARHPEGRPPITSKTSTSSPSPPLWVFVSKEPLGREADSFPNAQAKAATSVQELKIDRLFDSRVRSLNFLVPGGDSGEGKPDTAIPIVKGRYVRLQYASASSALQFAELEVFTQDSAVSTDRKGGSYATSSFQADDGFYGVFKSLDGAVLESDKVALIRDDIIRKRYVASSSSGKKIRLCTDNTHAQVFTVKAPVTAVDGSGCHSNGLSHRWTFDIYDCQSDVDSGSVKLLGSAYLLPFQINKHGEEDLTIPIFSTASHSIVGQLTLSYLVLMPFAHPKNNIAHVWRSYWRERPPLTIGHRGMGRSYYQVDGYRLALTRENTLASFIMAGRSGADFVEFDVQLTKDQVPIIYHDFLVNVGLEDKHAGSFGTKPEAYEIGIHDMTYRQLTQSHTTPVPHKGSKTQVLQNRLKKHWARLQGDKQVNSPRRGPITWDAEKDNIEEEHHLVDFFPRLEDLLKHVPAEVGLNVEIKYPDPLFGTAMRSSSQFAINAYLDKVLQCVFDHAGLRRIFFSCFDPNVCIALRAKQARYPVLFLTYGSMAPHAIDSRMTLQFATTFVKMEKLQGIVSNSKAFVETPELAPLVKRDLQSVLMTWGDQNTNHEMVQLQKRHAIDGVISDNVIDLINQDKKLQALAK
ncbi:Glycerophosphocholine phosphodiesterase gpcpd1 [Phytophthora boehmeriae]|uniref:Glycerophosphocholine phosphodiesterase gpcpd1 n=1 Tax=Phytophthora boehmeriae TaxID=109152 RepID=A0A8T1WYF7_9STRA|nr:Glycerophosphocholine phosphodiesterase gpcpd1 [Phytophthora boehmeriae]